MKSVPPTAFSAIRGTVTLVALCFVAVMGITLAGYIAVCSRAMNLSNRTFQGNLSKQLAEVGVDEALRAFNKNDWSDWSNGTAADWTVSGTTATCTMTFPADTFGQGVTGSVKIRIDNYNANQLDSNWNSTTTYRLNDRVGYSGSWYRCVRTNSNQTPSGITNMGYWVPDPMPAPLWDSTVTYKAEDVVYYTSTNSWYRCITTPTSGAAQAPGTGNWTSITKISLDNGYSSINGEVLNYFGTWYYRSGGNWRDTPTPTYSFAPVVSWCWRSTSYPYAFNDIVGYGYPIVWYRCKVAHTSSSSYPPTNTTYWENALTGMHGWSSSFNYNLGDVVYSSSSWYRCILANSNKTPSSNPSYWSAYPNLSRDWDSGKQYSQNDTVRYNGVWYLSLQNSNTNQNPVTDTTYWIGANTATASYQWNAATAYTTSDYRCYGGVWYKCSTGNTGQSPNNTSYWTAAWAQGSGVTTGAPVVYAEGTIVITGSPSLRTQLRATLAPAPLFPNAAAATTTISATSGGTVDSYDSVTDPTAATPGYSAVLAAGNTSGTAVTLSGALTVSGYVAAPSSSTSPYAPLFSYGTSTIVKGSAATPSPKVDLSRVSRSPSIPRFDPLPAGGLAATWANVPKGTALVPSYTTNIGTPGATTPSRYYYNGDLNMGGGSSVITIMNINGPVILYINGDLILNGSPAGRININASGSAEIHASGGFRIFSTSDGIDNRTLDPKRLILISDDTSASQHYNSITTPLLYGVIYTPNTTAAAGFQFNSGGGASTTLYGAVSAAKITYTNNMNVHYDTSLRYATFGGVDQPWTVTEWRELDVTEQATLP